MGQRSAILSTSDLKTIMNTKRSKGQNQAKGTTRTGGIALSFSGQGRLGSEARTGGLGSVPEHEQRTEDQELGEDVQIPKAIYSIGN